MERKRALFGFKVKSVKGPVETEVSTGWLVAVCIKVFVIQFAV